MLCIKHSVPISGDPDAVYQALTTSAGIRRWWTTDATVGSTVASAGAFGFHDRSVMTTVRIDEPVRARRVVWTTLESNAPGGWNGTVITFELAERGGATVLTFDHSGFAAANQGYHRVTAGWAQYLASLKQYIETGVGEPHIAFVATAPGP